MSKRKRKVLGEEPLGRRGMRENRYLMSKRRASGEDPYAWIEGRRGRKKVEKKAQRQKKAKAVKRGQPPKFQLKRIGKKPKFPAKFWNELKKIEKGAVLLPKEIVAIAKATRKVTGKITADLSKTIASGVVTGPQEARKVIRHVQAKVKAASLKNRMENLFAILGKECYRLIGKKRPVLKERRIQNLIKQIKDCQKELQKIEKEA